MTTYHIITLIVMPVVFIVLIAVTRLSSLTDAMLGLVQRSGSDAQASMASTSETRKALQSPRLQ